MQPEDRELDRAPHLPPMRETSPTSFLTRTRSAVRGRLRGAIGPEAADLPALGTKLTVGAFLEGWLTDVARVTVRPRTYVSYRYVVGVHLTPALGDLGLAALSPADVQAFLNAKSASGLSPRTVGYLRGVLRGALGHAERTDLVTRNVARLARPPRVPRRRVSPLSVEQVRTFLGAIAGDRLEALYLVALGVGLRQGEILGLRWSDVDLAGGTLTVRHALARIERRLELVEPKSATSRSGSDDRRGERPAGGDDLGGRAPANSVMAVVRSAPTSARTHNGAPRRHCPPRSPRSSRIRSSGWTGC
jgi:Phage integrase, N-terminal SAM-like domain